MSNNLIYISGSNFDYSNLISLIVTAIIGISTLLLMWFLFNKERQDRKNERNQIYFGLLNSLIVELNAVSSKSNDILINTKEYSLKGNLEWYEELLENNKGKKILPPHSLWKINTSEYLSKLPNKIKNKNIIELKKLLVLLNQKLELIQNYFSFGMPQEEIKNVIGESKEIVKDIKIFLNEKFGIR